MSDKQQKRSKAALKELYQDDFMFLENLVLK